MKKKVKKTNNKTSDNLGAFENLPSKTKELMNLKDEEEKSSGRDKATARKMTLKKSG